MRRKRRARRVVRLSAVLALEGAAAFALVTALSGDATPPADATEAPPPLTADDVAAEPTEYRQGEVTVTGRIRPRPTRVSAEDRYAFVLEGARDGRLLVVPADGAKLPSYRPGLAVAVRGTVVIPPNRGRRADHVASRTAVAERARASALLKAVEVDVVQ